MKIFHENYVVVWCGISWFAKMALCIYPLQWVRLQGAPHVTGAVLRLVFYGM
jgi:hypothetical protein